MTTKKLVGSFVLALASASLFYACSSSTSDPAESAAVSSQSLVYDGFQNQDVRIGEAFANDANQGLGYSCLQNNAQVTVETFGNGAEAEEYRPFISYDLTDAVDKLRWRLWPGDRELHEVWPGFSNPADDLAVNIYENLYFPGQVYQAEDPVPPQDHSETFSLLIYVRTVMEDVSELEADNENEWCPNEHDTVQDFEDECGDAYLDREIYGGYVLVTLDAEQLSVSDRNALYRNFEVDSDQHNSSRSALVAPPADQLQFEFHDILLNGLRPPDPA
jgi:hypothetical protein